MKSIPAIPLFLIVALYVGCSDTQSTQPSMNQVADQSNDLLAKKVASSTLITLTPEISEGLLYMREEEKLARDIYIAMAAKWNMSVFTTISVSEQRHMDALKILIDRYALTDPVGSNANGVFVNSHLQSLYNDLLARGLQSSKEALLVGQLIEQTDIQDLDKQLTLVSAGSDFATVYQNLKDGSLSHLAAFTRNLQRF